MSKVREKSTLHNIIAGRSGGIRDQGGVDLEATDHADGLGAIWSVAHEDVGCEGEVDGGACCLCVEGVDEHDAEVAVGEITRHVHKAPVVVTPGRVLHDIRVSCGGSGELEGGGVLLEDQEGYGFSDVLA